MPLLRRINRANDDTGETMKAFILIFLIGTAYATPLASANQSFSYLVTGMTPEKHHNALISGLKAVINGTKTNSYLTITSAKSWLESLTNQGVASIDISHSNLSIPPALNPVLPRNETGNTTLCQSDRERDWQSYCQSNILGSDCFCFGCEKKPSVFANWNTTKNMIMKNMEQIRKCVYVK
jgi:hypothetical protein